MRRETRPGRRRLPGILAACLLAIALVVPGPARADAFSDMFGFMFRMMLTMANVMSDVVDTDTGGWNGWGGWPGGYLPYGTGATAWPLMSGLYGPGGWSGVSPWTGVGNWPMTGFGMSPWNTGWSGIGSPGGYPGLSGYPFADSAYGRPYSRNRWSGRRGRLPYPVNGYPSQSSLLDGTWYGNTGEILTIRANRFQLRSGLLAITGKIRLQNNLLTLYTPQTNSVQVYTFARNQSDLILQDRHGKILTYRRKPGGFGNFIYRY